MMLEEAFLTLTFGLNAAASGLSVSRPRFGFCFFILLSDSCRDKVLYRGIEDQ
jgi:hypothetical protein